MQVGIKVLFKAQIAATSNPTIAAFFGMFVALRRSPSRTLNKAKKRHTGINTPLVFSRTGLSDNKPIAIASVAVFEIFFL
jgi:hypothetical protein